MAALGSRTIQDRIFRSLLLVWIGILLLGGLSVFSIYQSKMAFQATDETMDRNSHNFFDLRVSLDQTSNSFNLIGAKQGAGALQHLEEIRVNTARFHELLNKLESENKKLTFLVDKIQPIREKFNQVHALSKEAALAFVDGKNDVGESLAESLRRKLEEVRTGLHEMTGIVRRTNEADLFNLLDRILLLVASVAFGAILIPAAVMWAVVRRINRDLTGHVTNLYDSSQENILAAQELKDASESLSSAANEQSASVQETVASMAEMRSMLAQTASHVKESQRMAHVVTDRTKDGSRIMEKMESAMGAIEQSNAQLQDLEDIINGIKDKTRVINDIVFKTQLLSFNASIEAARAGQYGRGFAVVAEEVGNLAKMSGGASKEIDGLLNDSQKRVSDIVEIVHDRVRDAKSVSSEALMRFGEIAKEIVSISEKINHVGEATLEQEGGVEQTSRAMDQMSETTLENKRAAEQILGIAEISRRIGDRIKVTTGGVHELVGGKMAEEVMGADRPSIKEQKVTNSDLSDEERQRVISLIDKIAVRNSFPRSTKANGTLSADDPTFKKSK